MALLQTEIFLNTNFITLASEWIRIADQSQSLHSFFLIIKNAHRTHRHGGEVSRLSLPPDFSCAAMEPRTDEAITQRMPNQENCKAMELEKYNYIFNQFNQFWWFLIIKIFNQFNQLWCPQYLWTSRYVVQYFLFPIHSKETGASMNNYALWGLSGDSKQENAGVLFACGYSFGRLFWSVKQYKNVI